MKLKMKHVLQIDRTMYTVNIKEQRQLAKEINTKGDTADYINALFQPLTKHISIMSGEYTEVCI